MQKLIYIYSLAFLILLSVFLPASAIAMECPGSKLTQAQLVEIVNKARVSRVDLPVAFDNQITKVIMVRCLYVLYEVAVPESLNKVNTFTIDPFGQLVDFSLDNKNK